MKANTLRRAIASDVPEIQRIRHSVRENRLVSTEIGDRDVLEAIEKKGRGWVVEVRGRIVGFAIGDSQTGNIWALFVHPDHERKGYGRQLHDAMLDWLWSQGLDCLWLTTEPRTRAQRFYESAGWHLVGPTQTGDVRYEMRRPTHDGEHTRT
jgi:GNAT superfamily N-acetyltransferase